MSGVVSYKEETARLDSLLVHAGAEAMAPPQRGTRGHSSYGRPTRAAAVTQHDYDDDDDMDDDREDDDGSDPKRKSRSRRELPARAVTILKEWLLSEEHFTHPYPTGQDQIMLMEQTGIGKKQLKNWFTNARRRIWKPMIKKQLEEAKNAAANGMTPAEADRISAVAHAAQAAGISRGYEGLVQGMGHRGGHGMDHHSGDHGGHRGYSGGQHHSMHAPPYHRQDQYHQRDQYRGDQYRGDQYRGDQYHSAHPDDHQRPQGMPQGHHPYHQGHGYNGSMESRGRPPQSSYATSEMSHGQGHPHYTSSGDMKQQLSDNSLNVFSAAMPRAPSVGQMGSGMKKTDSLAFLEVFLQNETENDGGSGGGGGGGGFPRVISACNINRNESSVGMTLDGDEDHSSHHDSTTTAEAAAALVAMPKSMSSENLMRGGGGSFDRMGTSSSAHSSAMSSGNSVTWSAMSGASVSGGPGPGPHGGGGMGGKSIHGLMDQRSRDHEGMGQGPPEESHLAGQKRRADHLGGGRGGWEEPQQHQPYPPSYGSDPSRGAHPYHQPSYVHAPGGPPMGGHGEGGNMSQWRSGAYPQPPSQPLPPGPHPERGPGAGGMGPSGQDGWAETPGPVGGANAGGMGGLGLPTMRRASSTELLKRVASCELLAKGGTGEDQEEQNELQAGSVKVMKTAKCAFCVDPDVDTQLRPCGHLFHGRCLKPWLQAAKGPPKCLTCGAMISSCVLAIPSSMPQGQPQLCPPQGQPPGLMGLMGGGIPSSASSENLIQDAPTIEGDDDGTSAPPQTFHPFSNMSNPMNAGQPQPVKSENAPQGTQLDAQGITAAAVPPSTSADQAAAEAGESRGTGAAAEGVKTEGTDVAEAQEPAPKGEVVADAQGNAEPDSKRQKL